MRLVALVLIAVLALSFVPFLAMQQASALSAITFTTETTVTSYNEQWQQVYENGTASTVYLDAASNGTYAKHAWDGSTLDTDTSSLTGSGNTINSHAYTSPVDLSRYSLNFDGVNDDVTVAADATLNTVNTSYCFWVYPNNFASIYVIIDKRGVSVETEIYINTGGKVVAQITTVAGSNTVTATNALTAGTFNHVCVTYDGSTLAHYRNGAPNGSTAVANPGDLLTQNVAIYISSENPTGFELSGNLDDVLKYADRLTPAEVSQIYNGGFHPTDLELFLDFNDGLGTNALDRSGNGNNGILNDGPTWDTGVTANSQSRPSVYVTGRDTATGVNGYGKWNLADLSEVSDNYQSSDLAPLDIAQSTSNLYSTALNATAYGTLFDVSITRAFGSYIETSILTGDSTTPAMGLHMDVTAGTANREMSAAGGTVPTAVAEAALTSSVLIGGTFNAMTLRLLKEGSPPGTFSVGVLDSSNNFVFTCATETANTFLTTSAADYTFFCGESYTIALNDRIGIKYAAGDASNSVHIIYSSTQQFDGTASVGQENTGSWGAGMSGGTAADVRMKIANIQAQVVVYESGGDVRYHVFESGADTIRIVKRTGSTTLLGTSLNHQTGSPFSLIQLSDRIIIQTATDTYQLLTATDVISQIHTGPMITRAPQTFSVSPASRSYNNVNILLANSTYSTFYNPSTGSNSRTGSLIDSVVTGSSGVLNTYDPNRWYFLPTNDLAVEASAGSNTWSIKDIGVRDQVQVTAYSEALGIDLAEDTIDILNADTVKINCDNGNYLLEMQYIAVGDDSDCREWWTYDTSSGTIPRQLPYIVNGEVVHANPFTAYTIHAFASDPTDVRVTIIYDTKDVDMNTFDDSANAQVRLLESQCYTTLYESVSTDEELQTGNLCAGDVTTIDVIVSTTLGFPFWSAPWGVSHTYNTTSKILTTTVHHEPANFNYTVNIFNSTEALIVNSSLTAVGDVDIETFNMTSFITNSSTPFLLEIYNDNGIRIYKVYFEDQPAWLQPVAALFSNMTFAGWNILYFMPLIFGAIFTRNTVGIGAVSTVAFIGVLSWLGVIPIDPALFAIMAVIAAVGIIIAKQAFD